MAENTIWVRNYFNTAKSVVWAHNGHIANNPSYTNGNGGSMGNHLKQLASDYTNLGFSFTNGWFNSVSMNEGGLMSFEIKSPPYNSLNDVFSRTHETFFVEIARLSVNDDWNKYFNNANNYFSIGAGFSTYWLASYYTEPFNKSYFDYMIHIDKSSPSKILQ
jgi:erythromycin esterase-like protein